MATAADYLRAYRDQTGVDTVDAVASVVEFLSDYGMAESVVHVLCDLIDDQGMTRDFASELEANGLMTDTLDVGGDDVDLDADEIG